MIIESHTHYGQCRVFDNDISEAALIGELDKNQVDAALVQPGFGWADMAAQHDNVAALAARRPKRVFGVACPDIHASEVDYYAEAERCIRQLGFVGQKLHPLANAVNIAGKDATKAFETARSLGVPLIVHTGAGAPFALPSLLIPRAKQFPELPIVVAHAGANYYTAEAIIAAQLCPNLYLEQSWCGTPQVRGIVDAIGVSKILFGADMPVNIASELAKYRAIGLTPEQLERCLAGTAVELFKLPL